MSKRIGSATSSVEYSPAKRRRQAKARRAEEARWASLAGPVEVRRVSDGNTEAWSPDGGALPPSGEQAASSPSPL